MSYTAIADVSQSLTKLFRNTLSPEPIKKKENIGLCSPAEKGDFQLSLYLYNIEESGEFRQNIMIEMNDGSQKYPPKVFYLYYLLTAYSTADIKSKALDEHKILGKAIQILHDNQILSGSMLEGQLRNTDQEIRIETKNLSYDEMMRIWHFNDIPYSLSVAYKVGPIYIESTKFKKPPRVIKSSIKILRSDK
ncbi:DUF4255 domain-containing protein [Helicovermis profundi]|uniref:Pvc16 N-terminal domain-containing protein n=1 Tax=Helicovermis profundi TaxID=3065157 RepID=A0AAU9E6K1_9FIRM|nr:hypothetical protein HLPR_13540 [Clostridia bacterium S502]